MPHAPEKRDAETQALMGTEASDAWHAAIVQESTSLLSGTNSYLESLQASLHGQLERLRRHEKKDDGRPPVARELGLGQGKGSESEQNLSQPQPTKRESDDGGGITTHEIEHLEVFEGADAETKELMETLLEARKQRFESESLLGEYKHDEGDLQSVKSPSADWPRVATSQQQESHANDHALQERMLAKIPAAIELNALEVELEAVRESLTSERARLKEIQEQREAEEKFQVSKHSAACQTSFDASADELMNDVTTFLAAAAHDASRMKDKFVQADRDKSDALRQERMVQTSSEVNHPSYALRTRYCQPEGSATMVETNSSSGYDDDEEEGYCNIYRTADGGDATLGSGEALNHEQGGEPDVLTVDGQVDAMGIQGTSQVSVSAQVSDAQECPVVVRLVVLPSCKALTEDKSSQCVEERVAQAIGAVQVSQTMVDRGVDGHHQPHYERGCQVTSERVDFCAQSGTSEWEECDASMQTWQPQDDAAVQAGVELLPYYTNDAAVEAKAEGVDDWVQAEEFDGSDFQSQTPVEWGNENPLAVWVSSSVQAAPALRDELAQADPSARNAFIEAKPSTSDSPCQTISTPLSIADSLLVNQVEEDYLSCSTPWTTTGVQGTVSVFDGSTQTALSPQCKDASSSIDARFLQKPSWMVDRGCDALSPILSPTSMGDATTQTPRAPVLSVTERAIQVKAGGAVDAYIQMGTPIALQLNKEVQVESMSSQTTHDGQGVHFAQRPLGPKGSSKVTTGENGKRVTGEEFGKLPAPKTAKPWSFQGEYQLNKAATPATFNQEHPALDRNEEDVEPAAAGPFHNTMSDSKTSLQTGAVGHWSEHELATLSSQDGVLPQRFHDAAQQRNMDSSQESGMMKNAGERSADEGGFTTVYDPNGKMERRFKGIVASDAASYQQAGVSRGAKEDANVLPSGRGRHFPPVERITGQASNAGLDDTPPEGTSGALQREMGELVKELRRFTQRNRGDGEHACEAEGDYKWRSSSSAASDGEQQQWGIGIEASGLGSRRTVREAGGASHFAPSRNLKKEGHDSHTGAKKKKKGASNSARGQAFQPEAQCREVFYMREAPLYGPFLTHEGKVSFQLPLLFFLLFLVFKRMDGLNRARSRLSRTRNLLARAWATG